MDAQYRAEEQWSFAIRFASVLAVLIACLGLFGLTALMVHRRTKEIGIRKVLGASMLHAVTLLNREFLYLVLLANVIAWPAAYFAMSKWLEHFAYRIEMSWVIFPLAGAVALLIALLTVSYQTLQAALSEPVDSLRYA